MAASPHQIWLEARGLRFRALEWPQPGAPALLLHATSFCADVWTPVWEVALAQGVRGVRAVAVDARGHGGSAAPAGPEAYGWPCLAQDVLALAEAVAGRSESVVLIGHSSGGTAALAAAALRPERVRAVAVVEPVLYEKPSQEGVDSFLGSRALAERARHRRAAYTSLDHARSALRGRFPFSGFAPASFEAFLAGGLHPAPGGGVELRCAPSIEAACYAGAAALDLWPLLPAIGAPVLVIAGEHSAIPAALLERMRSTLRELRVERICGATHFAALERPHEVGAALGRFLAG